MEESTVGQFEELIPGQLEGLVSLIEDLEGNLTAVTSEGFIYSIDSTGISKKSDTGGQPFSLLYDSSSTLFITDLAQQAIYSYSEEESLQELIKSCEGKPFLGPNSLAFHEATNSLYFTDSGPMGETSLLNPRGSVYVADIEQGNIKHIILRALAHPAGIGVTGDGKTVYVAETYKNRLLKITCSSNGNYHTTVFHQFSGRLGPTALCVTENGMIYVANYEFDSAGVKGKVSVINSNGVMVKFFMVPVSEITSMAFSKLRANVLYITGSGKAFRVTIPG